MAINVSSVFISFFLSDKLSDSSLNLDGEAQSSNTSEDLFYFRHSLFHSGEGNGLPKAWRQIGV